MQPETSAQRMVTIQSPSPSTSHQPIVPAKKPRSNDSARRMAARAGASGHPHTAGVPRSMSASSSDDGAPRRSRAEIVVPRCHIVCVETSDGAFGTSSCAHHGASVSPIHSTTEACSRASLADARSRSAALRSMAASGERRAEPARGAEITESPRRRSSNSGVAPTSARAPPSASGSVRQNVVTDGSRRSRATMARGSMGPSVCTTRQRASTTFCSTSGEEASCATTAATLRS